MKANGSAMEEVKRRDLSGDARVDKRHSDTMKGQKGGSALTQKTATLIFVKCASDGACTVRKLAPI